METDSPSQLIEWATARHTVPGEEVPGVGHVCLPQSRGGLFTVIDGIDLGPATGPGPSRCGARGVGNVQKVLFHAGPTPAAGPAKTLPHHPAHPRHDALVPVARFPTP